MKRYLLFSHNGKYPQGGSKDFEADFDSEEEMMASISNARYVYNYYECLDTQTGIWKMLKE